ncbi:MAG: tyrosine--tRNA ligase [Bacteroidales bacterium]|nr:tyrosine--tRNA ligase [Bacteroidales bacterium]MCM1146500.1 tyrosine--tRNA ligase [Bacteroidales bacterium]MCM1207218.1 tyrosine--tRNA ligase [Bacillota bacterium]MCM1509308.1 tyrosine--tRNA ligase [Clostridium sp.]
MKNFVEELKWRGMLAQIMPGTEELLQKQMVTAYLGTDPTADSLHIGHLCGIMMLRHLQQCGHKPIILVGGATGMIGDPSGKSQERNLLDAETLYHNQECIKKQVAKFLDFDAEGPNAAEMVNNYDWMKDFTFLDFARTVGKHITVNYMMAKESVQQRLNGTARDGLSFTEFTYQLLQGYDFLHLYQAKNCQLQLGGNDQWGNMTTGTELIRRTLGNEVEAYALTCPLITKADGKKFGKTESGNIWLDRNRTTPYAFYQFWLNVSDEDAEKYIKIFTSLDKDTIDALVEEHKKDPGYRILQKRLAEEVTVMCHSQEDLDTAKEASNILFGKSTKDSLLKLDEQTLLDVFAGVPHYEIAREYIIGKAAIELLTADAPVFSSKGEMRKLTQGGGVSINKEKLADPNMVFTETDLLDGKYLLAQQGKKKYFLIIAK